MPPTRNTTARVHHLGGKSPRGDLRRDAVIRCGRVGRGRDVNRRRLRQQIHADDTP